MVTVLEAAHVLGSIPRLFAPLAAPALEPALLLLRGSTYQVPWKSTHVRPPVVLKPRPTTCAPVLTVTATSARAAFAAAARAAVLAPTLPAKPATLPLRCKAIGC